MRTLAILVWSLAVVSFAGPAAAQSQVRFVYDDLGAFGRAMASIGDGVDPVAAMTTYIESGSPALRAYADRYRVTPQAMAAAVRRQPRYYERLATLRPRLQAREADTTAALMRLTASAPPGSSPVPVYFLVGPMVAGGTPVQMASGGVGVAISIDMLAGASDVDLSEFRGAVPFQRLSDVPQVVVHEMAHVYQAGAQGVDNYLSIYRDGTRGTVLAVALREGCAEYLTWLAAGWRLGDRHLYGEANRASLWVDFVRVMDQSPASAPGWFSGSNPDRREWPMQIGYWMGMEMCRTYHEQARDPAAALANIYSAYRPEHFQAIARPYIERHGRR